MPPFVIFGIRISQHISAELPYTTSETNARCTEKPSDWPIDLLIVLLKRPVISVFRINRSLFIVKSLIYNTFDFAMLQAFVMFISASMILRQFLFLVSWKYRSICANVPQVMVFLYFSAYFSVLFIQERIIRSKSFSHTTFLIYFWYTYLFNMGESLENQYFSYLGANSKDRSVFLVESFTFLLKLHFLFGAS